MSTQSLLKFFWSMKPKLDPLYLIPDGWEVEKQKDLEFSHILKPCPFTVMLSSEIKVLMTLMTFNPLD